MTQFSFTAYNHKVTGPKSNNDSDVTLQTDLSERQNISPFALIPPATMMKVTIECDIPLDTKEK